MVTPLLVPYVLLPQAVLSTHTVCPKSGGPTGPPKRESFSMVLARGTVSRPCIGASCLGSRGKHYRGIYSFRTLRVLMHYKHASLKCRSISEVNMTSVSFCTSTISYRGYCICIEGWLSFHLSMVQHVCNYKLRPFSSCIVFNSYLSAFVTDWLV